mmetsp:Transcript_99054/g.288950  ORF Transcript_99054/g.288950 Transcript_99054/m.288950 type:complete len:370 (+) Transcript_99054:420-1529(+)
MPHRATLPPPPETSVLVDGAVEAAVHHEVGVDAQRVDQLELPRAEEARGPEVPPPWRRHVVAPLLEELPEALPRLLQEGVMRGRGQEPVLDEVVAVDPPLQQVRPAVVRGEEGPPRAREQLPERPQEQHRGVQPDAPVLDQQGQPDGVCLVLDVQVLVLQRQVRRREPVPERGPSQDPDLEVRVQLPPRGQAELYEGRRPAGLALAGGSWLVRLGLREDGHASPHALHDFRASVQQPVQGQARPGIVPVVLEGAGLRGVRPEGPDDVGDRQGLRSGPGAAVPLEDVPPEALPHARAVPAAGAEAGREELAAPGRQRHVARAAPPPAAGLGAVGGPSVQVLLLAEGGMLPGLVHAEAWTQAGKLIGHVTQ